MLVKLDELNLALLRQGIPALSKAVGGSMEEAGAICFDSGGHKSGVTMVLDARLEDSFKIIPGTLDRYYG